MNKKRFLGNTLAIVLVLAGVSAYSVHAATDFKSSGRLEYNNGTSDNPGDDVIFDSSDLKMLDTSIIALDGRISNISSRVNEGLQDIIDAIDDYPDVDLDKGNSDPAGSGESDGTAGTTPSFEQIVEAIRNITTLPTDTYFYENGTEGNANIARFKKVDGKYYPCDAHGEIAQDAAEADVSQKTLIDYTAAGAGNISAGYAGYADGNLHLGDGSDNKAFYEQMKEVVDTSSASYLAAKTGLVAFTNGANDHSVSAVLAPGTYDVKAVIKDFINYGARASYTVGGKSELLDPGNIDDGVYYYERTFTISEPTTVTLFVSGSNNMGMHHACIACAKR
ncbi:MAG: hypothetical protein IJP31_11165 [Lachnospiraceae bacterium]|nr:hypothetical protein [Lachnospiraceae bacterium]